MKIKLGKIKDMAEKKALVNSETDPPFEIKANNGTVFYVSKEDHDWAKECTWSSNTQGYLQCGTKPWTSKPIHRLIMQRMGINIVNLKVDHIDCTNKDNKKDNRRSQLRVRTSSGNARNKRMAGKSVYPGVRFYEDRAKLPSNRPWCAQICVHYQKRTKWCATKEEAIAVRKAWETEVEAEELMNIEKACFQQQLPEKKYNDEVAEDW